MYSTRRRRLISKFGQFSIQFNRPLFLLRINIALENLTRQSTGHFEHQRQAQEFVDAHRMRIWSSSICSNAHETVSKTD